MKTATTFAALGACALAVLPATLSAQTGWAINDSQQLISFDFAAPGTALTTANLSGLRGADGTTPDAFGTIYDLAFAGGTLYGIDGNANLYSLNPGTGAATFISSALDPVGFDAGLAYDPFTGGLRFVTDAGENITLSLTGTVAAGANLFYAPGDAHAGATPAFSALGIDADFGTGYALDATLDTLAMTVDANFAEFFTVGSLGIDVTALAAFDMIGGSLYAALSTDAVTSSFYAIDTTTGVATLLGSFDGGILAMAAIPEPSTYVAFAGLAVLAVAALRRRRAR